MAIKMTFRNFGPPPKKRKIKVATTKAPPPLVAPQVPSVPKPVVPSVPTFGANARFRTISLEWRELESGALHTEVAITGFDVPEPHRSAFWDSKSRVAETLAYHARTGQHFSKFFINDADGNRVGSGFFDSNVTADDIPYLFARLNMSGFTGHVAWTDTQDALLLDDYILAKMRGVAGDDVIAALDTLEPGTIADLVDSPEPEGGSKLSTATAAFKAAFPMPAFCDTPLRLSLQHGFDDNAPLEYLRFEPGDKLPDRFSALWHARRDAYREILAVCQPRNFIIYDSRDKRAEPTTVYQMRGEHPHTFHEIGTMAEGDGDDAGGFGWKCHGRFDETPSAETLAFIECRLASEGRWPVLVAHQYDFTPDRITNLINGATEGDENV